MATRNLSSPGSGFLLLPLRTLLTALLPVFLLIGLATTATAQLTAAPTDLPALQQGSAEWGDYDGDGDLDLAICGRDSASTLSTRIYRNDLTPFTIRPDTIPGVEHSALLWADLDSDGDLDLFVAGADSAGVPLAQIRRNDSGSFHSSSALTGVSHAAADYADVDGDGDFDLLVTGLDSGGQPLTRLYANDGGSFSDAGAGLLDVSHGSVGFADADEDGDPDLLLTGRDAIGDPRTVLYRNDSGTFVEVITTLPNVDESTVAWADFDNDGKMDLVLSGMGSTPFTSAYRNDGFPTFGNRELIGAALRSSSACWGDYDADGDPDIVVSGTDAGGTPQTLLYRHDGGGVFILVSAGLDSIYQGAARWADTDNDDRLELLVVGSDGLAPTVSFYDNIGTPNTRPSVVGNLATVISGPTVSFTWNQGFDPQTGALGLSYDLRIGSSPGAHDVRPAHAGPSTGYRRVVREGNVGHRTSWTIPLADLPSPVYWSVQAVDASYSGSEFAPEQTFHAVSSTTLGVVPSPSNEGQSVTMTATVTPSSATGTVQFRDGASFVANRTLTGGVASYTTSSLDAGLRSLTAEYLGDATTAPSLSAVFEHAVKVATTTAITSSPRPSLEGEEVTLTATVSPSTATGSVTFTDSNVSIGAATLSGGVATLLTSSLAVGNHQLRAVYDGDALHQGSTSTVRHHTVEGITTTTLATDPNPSTVGELTSLTATVSPSAAGGSVEFRDGPTLLGTRPLSGGVATLPHAFNAAGVRSLTAEYTGSGTYAPSISPVHPHVVTGATVVTIHSTPNPSTPGQSVSITATLDRPAATGTVTFRDGATELGTAPVSGGLATLPPITTMAIGVHPLTADYGGDAVYLPDVSDTLEHRVLAFQDIGAALEGVAHASVDWGDYDADGDLDVLVAGQITSNGWITKVYVNNGGTFTPSSAVLPGAPWGEAAWGDFDNDGRLDVLLVGLSSAIYRNTPGGFVNIGAGLPSLEDSDGDWGDYDNDGDLDLILVGEPGIGSEVARIYRNDAGTFVDSGISIVGVSEGDVKWGDFEPDGDLDILMTGDSPGPDITRVYVNNGGVYSDLLAGIPGTFLSSADWGDQNNDGDLDIALVGVFVQTSVFAHDGSGFPLSVSLSASLGYASVTWGDGDGDGLRDLLVTGYDNDRQTSFYRSSTGSFIDFDAGLTGVGYSDAAWGDFDNDGRLDVLLAGDASSGLLSQIARNLFATVNQAPSAPTGLSASRADSSITFSWSAATDAETPAPGLTYNLRVGTTPGGNEIVSCMADPATGFRHVAAMGNCFHRLSWTLNGIPASQPVYWSVQAVDAAFAGSAFAPEQQLSVVSWDIVQGGLPGSSYYNRVAWGDWDNDSDLDLIIAGEPYRTVRIFRNLGGTFGQMSFPGLFPAIWGGSATWGDYDGDGELDLALAGVTSAPAVATTFAGELYRNLPGLDSFAENAGAPAMPPGVVDFEWVDVDNDGDLDLAMVTFVSSEGIGRLRIFRNDAGSFFDSGIELPATAALLAAADYDRDGDTDLLTSDPTGGALYRNDNGLFTNAMVGLPGAFWADWGDYDNDGWPDVVLAGPAAGVDFTLYRNAPVNAGNPNDPNRTFTLALQKTGSPGLGKILWGDYDNDGRLDLFGTGRAQLESTKLFHNDGGGVFTEVATGLPEVTRGDLAWGDFDNDGDLDMFFSGLDASTHGYCFVARNNVAGPNSIPTAPTGLSVAFSGGSMIMTWDAATDAETPSPGLSYNIRVGTTPGGDELMPGMSDPVTGFRRVVRTGNAGQGLSWALDLAGWPENGEIHVAVQAVDGAFAGSPWASLEVSGVEGASPLPENLALHAASPSPFSRSTRIAFDLASDGAIRLAIHDVQGRLVRVLADGPWSAGRHGLTWDGRDARGHRVGPGVYFSRLEAGGRVERSRIVRIP